jgi:hypothetical protein
MKEESAIIQNKNEFQNESTFVNHLVQTYSYVDKGGYLIHPNFKKYGIINRNEEQFLELYYSYLETLKTYVSDEVEIAEAYHFYWSHIKPIYDMSFWGTKKKVPVYRNKIPFILFLCEFGEEYYTKMNLLPNIETLQTKKTYKFSIEPQSKYGVRDLTEIVVEDVEGEECDFSDIEFKVFSRDLTYVKDYFSISDGFVQDSINEAQEVSKNSNQSEFEKEDWYLKFKKNRTFALNIDNLAKQSETLCDFLNKVVQLISNEEYKNVDLQTIIISLKEEWFTYQDGYFIKILHKYRGDLITPLFHELKKNKPSIYKNILNYSYIIHPIYLFSDATSKSSLLDYSDLIREMLIDGFRYDEIHNKMISERYSLDTTAIKSAYTSIVLYGNEKEKVSIGLVNNLIWSPKNMDNKEIDELWVKTMKSFMVTNQTNFTNKEDFIYNKNLKKINEKSKKITNISKTNLPISKKIEELQKILAE